MLLMVAAFWCIGVPAGVWLGYFGIAGSGPLQVYGFWVGLVVGLVLVSLGLAASLRQVADQAVRGAA
jgi:MATE family multidrug resistance protein